MLGPKETAKPASNTATAIVTPISAKKLNPWRTESRVLFANATARRKGRPSPRLDHIVAAVAG